MTIETPLAPAPAQVHVSGEDLYELGHPGRVELVKGEIVSLSPTGRMHGIVEGNIYFALRSFCEQSQLGEVVVGEAGVYTSRDPDTVRGMDVAFISRERLSQTESMGYLDVAPELIVEVLSPHDRWSDVTEKLVEYFAIGVKLVWVADPRTRQIHVYTAPTQSQIFGPEDTLTGEPVLPGFSAPVSQLLAV